MKIPIFQGKSDPESYLEWERKVELIFECHNFSEKKKVRLTTFEFTEYANMWWYQVTTNRRRDGELPVSTWAEMKTIMRMEFVKTQAIVEGTVHSHVQLENKAPISSVEDNEHMSVGELCVDNESAEIFSEIDDNEPPTFEENGDHAIFKVCCDEPTKIDEDNCDYTGSPIFDVEDGDSYDGQPIFVGEIEEKFSEIDYNESPKFDEYCDEDFVEVCFDETTNVVENFQNRTFFGQLKSAEFDDFNGTWICGMRFCGGSHDAFLPKINQAACLQRRIFMGYGQNKCCELIFYFRPTRAPPWFI
jgi:hypothetical protein